MKKIIIPYLVVLICLGCDDLFHEEAISIGDIESAEEMESAVNGVYAKLASAFTDDAWIYNIFCSVNLKGDDLGETDPFYKALYENSENCGNDSNPFYHSWSFLYSVIASANNIIIQFDPELEQDETIKRLLGEAYLLRAYCYFRLTRTYGRIPLIQDIEIDYTSQLPSFRENYEFIESDLKTAMALLPENNSNARVPYVTPHRGTAKALLAELYLAWAGYPVNDDSKYALAAGEAGEVIDSADFFGFSLEEDFAHVWDKAYRYNSETVLALFFADPFSTDNLSEINMYYYGWCRDDDYGTFLLHPDSSWLKFWHFASEINFYNRYPKGYRKDITFYTTIYVPNKYPYYPQIDTGYVYVDRAESCTRPLYRKFFYNLSFIRREINIFTHYVVYGNSKVYLLRYAQILLTYAEAMARSGQLNSEAYEAANQIRRRAYHVDIHSASPYDIPSGLSAEAFADSVIWERAWELAGEPEGRWFDLVRLEMVEDLPNLRNPDEEGFPESTVTKEDYFFTIPEEEQLLNPNLAE